MTEKGIKLAVMQNDIGYIKEAVGDIKTKLESNYVTKNEFKTLEAKMNPVRKIVYGFVGLVLTAVCIAMIGMVIVR